MYKIRELSSSVKCRASEGDEIVGVAGRSFYIAPEVYASDINRKVANSGSPLPRHMSQSTYDARCDVWSVGVIVHYLLTAKLPFNDYKGDTKVSRVILGCPDRPSLEGPEW